MTPQKFSEIGTYFEYFNPSNNNQIVLSKFNQQGQNGADLWIIDKGNRRLTKTNFMHESPSFSRDGKHIYYISRRGRKIKSDYEQNSYIWRISSMGSGGLTRIGTPMYKITNPTESPDGKKIMIVSQEFRNNSKFIWIMEKNGALPTQIKQGSYATWIDQNTIVFHTKDENTGLYTIWACKTDGSELTQIISDNEMDCIQPSASSSGQHIVFVKQKPGKSQTRDLYIHNRKDGLIQQVTTNISRDDIPKWSPDDQYIYFRSSRGLKWSIWRLSTKFLNMPEKANTAKAAAK